MKVNEIEKWNEGAKIRRRAWEAICYWQLNTTDNTWVAYDGQQLRKVEPVALASLVVNNDWELWRERKLHKLRAYLYSVYSVAVGRDVVLFSQPSDMTWEEYISTINGERPKLIRTDEFEAYAEIDESSNSASSLLSLED